jgi:hypothetical protein
MLMSIYMPGDFELTPADLAGLLGPDDDEPEAETDDDDLGEPPLAAGKANRVMGGQFPQFPRSPGAAERLVPEETEPDPRVYVQLAAVIRNEIEDGSWEPGSLISITSASRSWLSVLRRR